MVARSGPRVTCAQGAGLPRCGGRRRPKAGQPPGSPAQLRGPGGPFLSGSGLLQRLLSRAVCGAGGWLSPARCCCGQERWPQGEEQRLPANRWTWSPASGPPGPSRATHSPCQAGIPEPQARGMTDEVLGLARLQQGLTPVSRYRHGPGTPNPGHCDFTSTLVNWCKKQDSKASKEDHLLFFNLNLA